MSPPTFPSISRKIFCHLNIETVKKNLYLYPPTTNIRNSINNRARNEAWTIITTLCDNEVPTVIPQLLFPPKITFIDIEWELKRQTLTIEYGCKEDAQERKWFFFYSRKFKSMGIIEKTLVDVRIYIHPREREKRIWSTMWHVNIINVSLPMNHEHFVVHSYLM